jgi:hypothetical protein
MGTKIDKILAEVKYKQIILDIIIELDKRQKNFETMYRATNNDAYKRALNWIENKIIELSELL